MIELELIDPCWITGVPDNPDDQCAHGKIKLIVDGLVISDGTEEWTVSAAALFLLRSVFHNHERDNRVTESNLLIPCCGFTPYKVAGERFTLLLMGCHNGIDPYITHDKETVTIELDGIKRSVPVRLWAKSIVAFTKQVVAFYDACSPKSAPQDPNDRDGWHEFWRELNENALQAAMIAAPRQ